jgi:hypothetical protein
MLVTPQAEVVYEIVVVPVLDALAVTRPVELLTVAIRVLLLLHMPPDVASLSAVVVPVQTDELPETGDAEFIVMVAIAWQPVPGIV